VTGRRTVSTRSANLFYVTTDALRSLKENFTTTVFTSVTLGFALALFSLFLIVFINLNGIITQWGERAHVVAYLAPGVDSKDAKGIEARLKGMEGVLDTTYVSSKDALDDLRSELRGHESILEGVNPGLLPASFEISIAEDHLAPDALSRLVAAVEGLAGVEEVSYSREWVEKFSAFLSFIELAALVIGIFLATAILFIISNTIRLTVYARRDEIEIMRLVGASERFIKFPFFIEGVVQGLIGGVLAMGILAAARALFASRIPPYFDFVLQFPVPVPALLAALVIAGIFMGVVGSFVSMARFLKV
jgi:cell division transport system permease protein